MRRRHLYARERANAIGEKRQGAGCCDFRIELAQATGGGIARVGELFLPGIALALIQPRKIALEHQHFAPDFQHFG